MPVQDVALHRAPTTPCPPPVALSTPCTAPSVLPITPASLPSLNAIFDGVLSDMDEPPAMLAGDDSLDALDHLDAFDLLMQADHADQDAAMMRG